MSPLHARKLHPRISKWFLSFQLGSILGRSSNDFEALRVENRRHDPSLSFSSPPREKRFSLQAIVSNHRASNRKQIRSSVLSPYISRACPFYLFSFFHSFFLLLFPDVWTASIALVNLNAIGHETKRSEQVAREYARARDRERVRTHAHARVRSSLRLSLFKGRRRGLRTPLNIEYGAPCPPPRRAMGLCKRNSLFLALTTCRSFLRVSRYATKSLPSIPSSPLAPPPSPCFLSKQIPSRRHGRGEELDLG